MGKKKSRLWGKLAPADARKHGCMFYCLECNAHSEFRLDKDHSQTCRSVSAMNYRRWIVNQREDRRRKEKVATVVSRLRKSLRKGNS